MRKKERKIIQKKRNRICHKYMLYYFKIYYIYVMLYFCFYVIMIKI